MRWTIFLAGLAVVVFECLDGVFDAGLAFPFAFDFSVFVLDAEASVVDVFGTLEVEDEAVSVVLGAGVVLDVLFSVVDSADG